MLERNESFLVDQCFVCLIFRTFCVLYVIHEQQLNELNMSTNLIGRLRVGMLVPSLIFKTSRFMHCVVPENIQTPTTEGIGNSGGVGGSEAQEIPEGRGVGP